MVATEERQLTQILLEREIPQELPIEATDKQRRKIARIVRRDIVRECRQLGIRFAWFKVPGVASNDPVINEIIDTIGPSLLKDVVRVDQLMIEDVMFAIHSRVTPTIRQIGETKFRFDHQHSCDHLIQLKTTYEVIMAMGRAPLPAAA